MKIFIIVRHNPFFENFATSNRWLSFIRGLSSQGVTIELLITGGYHTIPEYKRLGKSGTMEGIPYTYLTFQFNHLIWLKRINYYLLFGIYNSLISARIVKIARENRKAVFWTSSDYTSFRVVTRLKEAFPDSCTFLEIYDFMDTHHYSKGNFVQRCFADLQLKYFEKRAFFAYDALALMTKALLDYYQKFPKPGPELIQLPMTVDLDRFDQELPVPEGFQRPYIAFVGMMNDLKDGVSILIHAFAKIQRQFPEYTLYLVGGWHYDTPIHQRLIRELGLEDKICWKGEFSWDKIPPILRHASLLVLPRPHSKQAAGGFPTKLGEYLATGNPVCATMVGELPDYLSDGESVFFAEPDSIDSFAEAMQRAMSQPEKARVVGINGRKIAETYFNKDIQAKKLVDFLKGHFRCR